MERVPQPPVYVDRPYGFIGYLLYSFLGIIVLHYKAPSLLTAAGPSITVYIGMSILIFAAASAVVVLRDSLFRWEAVLSGLSASAMAPYAIAAVVTSFTPPGEVDEGRAAFSVIVFIATAVLWARCLTLVRRWANKAAADRAKERHA